MTHRAMVYFIEHFMITLNDPWPTIDECFLTTEHLLLGGFPEPKLQLCLIGWCLISMIWVNSYKLNKYINNLKFGDKLCSSRTENWAYFYKLNNECKWDMLEMEMIQVHVTLYCSILVVNLSFESLIHDLQALCLIRTQL